MQIKTETKVGIFVLIAIAILVFMFLGIGVFRFSTSGYSRYVISFKDVAGLSRKAEVKIAGVKVGWVEDITLTLDDHQARAEIMVHKKYTLYDNAYGIVRQEGLIGTKYLELIPGDPLLPRLHAGSNLSKVGRESVSIDELMHKFKDIAAHVEQVTHNISEAFTGQERAEQLKSIVTNFSQASKQFDSVTGSLNRVVSYNENVLHNIVSNVDSATGTMKDGLPELKNSLVRAADRVEVDFGKISDSLCHSAHSISRAADNAEASFSKLESVTKKIDEGKGVLGKLINEEELYRDIRSTVTGMKNYLAKFDSLGIVIDMHSETMHRPTDSFRYEDAKGYFDLKIHTSDSFFYGLQVVTSEKGFMERKYFYKDYYDEKGNKLDYSLLSSVSAGTTADIAKTNENKFKFAPEQIRRERKQWAFGFQFGKIYSNLALRVGLFESAFGAGFDYYISLRDDSVSWITSLEIFDFKGYQRFDRDEERPHLKWINRLFIFDTVYFTFGVDDFVSKNVSTFLGIGLRFGDDDLKYLLSKFGLYVTT